VHHRNPDVKFLANHDLQTRSSNFEGSRIRYSTPDAIASPITKLNCHESLYWKRAFERVGFLPECRRNVELMWLLGRLYPDHMSIAEFRRMRRDAITAPGAELIRFARRCGLIRGEWIAIDGSKFRAVALYSNTGYVLEGCLAAFKSRNLPSCLYSNPGPKPMHGKRIVSSLCLYPGQTSAGTSSGFYVQQSGISVQ